MSKSLKSGPKLTKSEVLARIKSKTSNIGLKLTIIVQSMLKLS